MLGLLLSLKLVQPLLELVQFFSVIELFQPLLPLELVELLLGWVERFSRRTGRIRRQRAEYAQDNHGRHDRMQIFHVSLQSALRRLQKAHSSVFAFLPWGLTHLVSFSYHYVNFSLFAQQFQANSPKPKIHSKCGMGHCSCLERISSPTAVTSWRANRPPS